MQETPQRTTPPWHLSLCRSRLSFGSIVNRSFSSVSPPASSSSESHPATPWTARSMPGSSATAASKNCFPKANPGTCCSLCPALVLFPNRLKSPPCPNLCLTAPPAWSSCPWENQDLRQSHHFSKDFEDCQCHKCWQVFLWYDSLPWFPVSR